MSADRIAVVDLETTGFSPRNHDRVVEIAIVLLRPDGTILTEYDTLLNPMRDVGPSSIHRISSGDVLKAPKFDEVAGDVLELLASATVIAGHNVAFDRRFLVSEYERIGVELPEVSAFCTYSLCGRSSLAALCEEFDIPLDNEQHRALSDARRTAQIVRSLWKEDPAVVLFHRLNDVSWPQIPPRRTACYRREHAIESRERTPRFIERIASRIRHDVDAAAPNLLAYLALIDRVLEDRVIDDGEEETLVEAATSWGLTKAQVDQAHSQYLFALSVAALSDGVVTDSERRDLHAVAELLGQRTSALDHLLEQAASQLMLARRLVTPQAGSDLRQGQRVCFTGELQSTLKQRPVTREIAEALASHAGLVVAGSVTKKLDILVVADPNTQSTKARKAREYGIRIVAESVFWKMLGVVVD